MGDGDLCDLSVHDLAGCIRRRDIYPVEVVETQAARAAVLPRSGSLTPSGTLPRSGPL